jgi:glycerol-1-phosphate dehydrogenase [NAD(P)+]
MNAWGYADLLAKVPAGADWILADALAGEAIDPRAWSIVQPRLRELLGGPEGVRSRQPEAIARLVEGLMLAGFAMQASRSSRAASGAEHQFSHLWDMQHHTHEGRAPSHGFKVGIGTLASTALCEFMLTQSLDQLDIEACIATWPDESGRARAVRECFGEGELTALALHESGAKALEAPALRAHLEQVRRLWPELRGRVREQLIPFARLKAMLQDVGAPVEPEQIGITRQRLRESYRQACFIRRRFTVLDLAIRTGYLDRALDHIFGPQGAWPS